MQRPMPANPPSIPHGLGSQVEQQNRMLNNGKTPFERLSSVDSYDGAK